MSAPEPCVFVIGDDKSTRKTISDVLKAKAGTVEIFASAEEYLAREAHDGPACLVANVQLPGLDGLAFQRRLAGMGRDEAIVFITEDDDLRTGIQAMKQGAVDFLLKPFDDKALRDAVLEGIERSAAEWRQREETVKVRARLATLTAREFQVFRFVISGLLNKQIAAELDAALRTIKRHRGCMMQKLGVVSVAELVRLAQKAGVAPESDGPKVPYTKQ